ncbi:MAG: hypothetical protein KAI66_10985, partial [Lentisphaeria bacterium]|nr:hypothetical protein [Lentisphaeria bacterium]
MKDTNTDDARGAMIELRIDTGRIAELALLSEKTELVGPSDCAGIIAPETEGFQECAVCLRDELATLTGTQLPLLGDTFALDATCLPRNIIALGHAGNNTLLRRLHYLGYFSHGDYSKANLRVISIHNPFGDGHNVLAVLGATAKACARGSERLLERLSCTDGRWGIDERLFEVEPRPETPDPQKLLDEADARDPGSYAGRPGAFLTALNHLNSAGEERWARAFIQLVTPYATGEAPLSFWLMSAVDFWTDTLVIAWDKAEAFSYFSDDERLLVANFIASCTEYCHDSITYQKWRITEDEHQVFNHHTFPAKGLYFGCMHLRRHGYEVVDIDAWLAKSSQVFDRASRGGRSFDEGGGGYSWLVGNHLLQVCLAQGDTSYARSEKMLRYADLAITIQNNRFDLVPFGDCGGYHTRGDNAANILLRAAEWHGDSGLKWVAEQSAPAVVAADVFTRELRSAPPEKHVGLFVLPLEPVVHQWTDLPRFPNYPPPVRLTNVPVEKCFDKFSFRGGWGADDDYVLAQGFGDGQHGHPDANSISQYQVGGRLFLVDNDYIRRMPKQHNTIMVIRDGGHDPVPVTARLDFAEEFSGGALTQSVLVDYNGCDWTRRLLWLKGDCLLAIDMLEAREAGDYELRCYWRTLGSADSTEHGMHAEHDGEHFHVIELTGSDRRLDLECLPLNSTEYPKYNYGEGSPKVLCEKRVLHLSAGEKVCFVNLLLPNANAESPRRSVRWDDADGIVLDGEGISVTARPGSVEVDGREELTLPEEHRLLVEQNAGTSTAARPASIQRSGLAEVWRLQLPGVATCFAPMEDGGALVGCDDGTVGVVNSTGDFCQFYQATGRIGAVHAGRLFGESEVTCLATGDDAQLRFFRTDG